MKKLISTHVLACKYCQYIRMTGEAKPLETEAAESELSVSVIPVEKSKEEEKTLMLSWALQNLLLTVRRTDKFQIMVKGWKESG